jgi:hypothetical protein
MELHLVDAVAVTVVRPQSRRVLVRQSAEFERLTAAHGTELSAPTFGPGCGLAAQRLGQRAVLGEEVVARERRRLVRSVHVGARRHVPDYPARLDELENPRLHSAVLEDGERNGGRLAEAPRPGGAGVDG